MNLLKVVAKAGRKAFKPVVKVCQKVKTSKPEIFVGIGVAAVAVSFVWVAVEAMKAPETMTETSEKVKDIEDKYAAEREKEDISQAETEELKKKEKKELRTARLDGTMKMVKLFGWPVLCLLLGIGLIIHGHHILVGRYALTSAALKGTEEMFQFYRNNVIEAEGKEADQRYMRGVVGEKEVDRIVLDECGNEVVKKEKIPVVKKNNPWQFEYSPTFFRSASGDPNTDLTHLKIVEDYFNRVYSTYKKYEDISMFEVLEYLNPIWEAIDPDGQMRMFARTQGWGHDKRGDDRIDLGVYRAANEAAIKGTGDVVFLEMNCDGRLDTLKNQYKARYIQA